VNVFPEKTSGNSTILYRSEEIAMTIIVDSQTTEIRQGRFSGVSFQVLMGADNGSPEIQMATMMLEPGSSLPLHVHHDSESFFVLEGTGVLEIEGEKFPIGPQTAMLAPPGKVHGFRNTGTTMLKILCMHPIGQPTTKFIES
jgi:mannose-6-phosphate isomerase-like protein (cupin superfamily)